jgi:fatty-acyl-CoA synthase
MSDWNFARVWDELAGVVGARPAVVCGDRRLDFAEFADRAARLTGHLAAAGVRPGDRVAIDLVNRPEYLETFFAAALRGAVPVNVNYRYGPAEIAYLLADADAAAVVTEPAFAPAVREACDRVAGGRRAGAPHLLVVGPEYERALASGDPRGPWRARRPSGDDLIFLYTGGTTGMPKGVMWRHDDLYVALWQMARPGAEPPDPIAAARAGKRAPTALPACPLMHGTGLFIALSTLAGGGTVVLIDRPGLDAALVWEEVARHGVEVLTIVGDAFARPLLEALETSGGRTDLGCLRAVTSSGVTWSPETKRGLLRHLPQVLLLDSLGASEGLMTRSAARASDAEIRPARFAVNERIRVITDDGRDVRPGSGEVGMVAVGGRLPLGYHNDPDKTARTFRTIDGRRWSVPGDHATVEPDGTIRLLGRGSAKINTGGEKVYPEEVELALRRHPAVADCVVVGVPDARFGETVVAVVAPAAGTTVGEADLREHARREGLAGYKLPRRVVVLPDGLGRAPNGKADYGRLRRLAAERLGVEVP